ncbi:unnamed protein product [Trypanosoma congolense IL3000]|uniref:WGS project CAEQ00000000 data, annotated contig 2443 n=1 Tax=Trypanosoma congolense (strain IL3000) TaxID=1068625 RepID=F9WE72_TRYCI|nr:unnamed protein product [Trypanosoma congolense IL3000]
MLKEAYAVAVPESLGLTRVRTASPPWTTSSTVDNVLLHELKDKRRIHLYHFPLDYGWDSPPSVGLEVTLGAFLRDPRDTVVEEPVRQQILQHMPGMLSRLYGDLGLDLQALCARGLRTLEDWAHHGWYMVDLSALSEVILEEVLYAVLSRFEHNHENEEGSCAGARSGLLEGRRGKPSLPMRKRVDFESEGGDPFSTL